MHLSISGGWHSRLFYKAVKRVRPTTAALESAFDAVKLENTSFACVILSFHDGPLDVVRIIPSTKNILHVQVGYDRQTPLDQAGAMILRRTAEVLPSVICKCPLGDDDRNRLTAVVKRWAESVGCGTEGTHPKFVLDGERKVTSSAAVEEEGISSPNLLIPYENGKHCLFNLVGRYGGSNQYMAFVTAAFPADWRAPPPDEFRELWPTKKRWYAVLHRFDSDGNHLGTDARFCGTTADGEDKAIAKANEELEKIAEPLGPRTPCDIRVRPFGATIDGCFFGLVFEHFETPRYEGTYGTADSFLLEPILMTFDPPFDSGKYST
jgi:formate hydrogenlyase regulatory protein HycA